MEERKMTIEERIDSALAAIRRCTSAAPELGLILGSGLGDFCDRLEDRIEVPFDQLPGFPLPTVEGHAGPSSSGPAGAAPWRPCGGASTTMRATPSRS